MLESLLYLLYPIGIMIITGIIKEHNLFSGIYKFLSTKIKSKRLFVVLFSTISGILPIPGRCIVSASLLDTIITKDTEDRKKFGLIDYLSTHHYYFWSPLEKTVIIPIVALGITYATFMSYIWPLLAVYLLFTYIYIFVVLKEDDVVINTDFKGSHSVCHALPIVSGIGALIYGLQPWIVFSILPFYYIIATKTFKLRTICSYIDFKLLGFLAIVLLSSVILKSYLLPLIATISTLNTLAAFGCAWLLAFALGSSSKFAGIVAILVGIFGIQYLPMLFALEFSAYLLSPTHKCVIISKEYFKTDIKQFYYIILLVALYVLLAGTLTTFLLLA